MLKPWLEDENVRVKRFAKKLIAGLKNRAALENRRSEAGCSLTTPELRRRSHLNVPVDFSCDKCPGRSIWFLSGGCARMSREDIRDVTGSRGYGPGPVTEAAMRVDGVDPFVEKPALGLVLIVVASLGFQYQHVTRPEPDEKVGTILPHHSAIDVEHFEAEVIVFHPGRYGRVAIKLEGFRSLPRAVIDAKIDMAFHGVRAGFAGVPRPHVVG